MPALEPSQTSKALAVSGGYVVIVGLVSYFIKEKLFISEALLATLAGIIFGPLAANIFSPLSWSGGSQSSLNYLTFEITRVVIAIQVLFTGIALPKAYLRREWLSLTTLLGPIMLAAWFITSLLIWGLIPGLSYLESLVIGACVTPTDPVLANSICKGRFAEKHVPLHVRNIIVAESGANDGLGYPFLYIALYLILIKEPDYQYHTIGGAIGEWIYDIILYEICLSVALGAIIGCIARKVLRFAEERNLIDHESFLSFGVALTFFTLGCVGMLGSDDILCCFIVGNAFTWDDWFRVQTEDHAFQDVIDQLLSSGIFLYIGAILPWSEFGEWYGITPWRLVILGICVMLVRRLPWVVLLLKWIPALPTWREAAFAGFFGPIGVGAVFYTQVALQVIPESRENLRNTITPVVYFLVLTSIVVHGVTIPIGKGFQNARSLTITRSQTGLMGGDKVSRLPAPLPLGSAALSNAASLGLRDGEREREREREGQIGSGESSIIGGGDAGTAIRFDLERGQPEREAPNSKGGAERGRKFASILGSSRSNTPNPSPHPSRPNTPPRGGRKANGEKAGGDEPNAESLQEGDDALSTSGSMRMQDVSPAARGRRRSGSGDGEGERRRAESRSRHDELSGHREDSSDRKDEHAWSEGSHVVVESHQGETVRVMSKEEFARMKAGQRGAR